MFDHQNRRQAEDLVAEAMALVGAGAAAQAVALLEANGHLVIADAEASILAGVLYLHEGHRTAALGAFETATRLDPASARARRNRAVALSALERHDEALADLSCATALDPRDPEIPFQRGNILLQLGRAQDAADAYLETVELRPDHVEALCQRGNACQALGRFREAVECYDAAIAVQPQDGIAWTNRGNALQGEGQLAEALASYDEALRHRPDDAETLGNRAVALQRLGRIEEALAAYSDALALGPDLTETWINQGKALHEAGLLPDAVASYQQALAREPAHADARFNLGLALLVQGDYSAGWQAYEARWMSKHRPDPIPGASWPDWRGGALDGTRLLVMAEQGHGDLIQFARFIPRLAAQGASVTLLAPRRMHRVLAPLAPACRIIDEIHPADEFDCQIPLMSVPGRLGLAADGLASPAYLKPEPALAARWANWLSGASGLRVGIAWQGNPAYAADARRSIPLAVFARLAAAPGVRLISLQCERGLEQLDTLPPGSIERPEPPLDTSGDAFVDTAALMASLDLVVTSDTAIAHLAGALGRPTWLALARVPDWRWGLQGQESRWYPTMRLFRQKRDGDWDSVFAAMAAALAELPRAEPERDLIRVPISIGELVDKITILEIKLERIADPDKRRSVALEHGLLVETHRAQGGGGRAVVEASAALKRVNETLWDLEDEIRLCEQTGSFGARFTEIARAIYKTNDRRAEIKRQINALFGSTLTEVKSYAA